MMEKRISFWHRVINLIAPEACMVCGNRLGIDEEVTSPTYAYMNDYDGRLFHYDCYRIESIEQAERLGLADYFDMGGICIIEWAQNIAPLLPRRVKRVTIKKISENEREILCE